jgi:hypothetical protein
MRQAIQMPIKAAEVVASGCSKIAPGKARDGLRQMVTIWVIVMLLGWWDRYVTPESDRKIG